MFTHYSQFVITRETHTKKTTFFLCVSSLIHSTPFIAHASSQKDKIVQYNALNLKTTKKVRYLFLISLINRPVIDSPPSIFENHFKLEKIFFIPGIS